MFFVTEPAFAGFTLNVTVFAPVAAEPEAATVHDIPAPCAPEMSEGEQPEDIEKSLGETVIVPNLAVVSPEFCKFKVKENVEPCTTLAEPVLNSAESDGGFLTSNDALPASGLHVPETLTEIDCEFALVALIVVHETLDPLKVLLWLSDTLHTGQLVKSRYAELQLPLQPEAVTVNVSPPMTLPESAPDWDTATDTVAETGEASKANITKKDSMCLTIHIPPHKTIFQVSRFPAMFLYL